MRRFLLKFLVLLTVFTATQTVLAQSIDARFLTASPATIVSDPALSARLAELAEPAIAEHCAGCHGSDLTGRPGFPDLVDYDWLWDITGFETSSVEPVFSIMQTMLYGIRDTDCAEEVKRYGACPDTRYSEMPAYGQLGFTGQQIDDLVEYTLSISGRVDVDSEAVARVAELAVVCSECHGEDGWGYKPYGGPDLSDAVWLYGGSREEIRDVLNNGRLGSCPPFENVLDLVTIKAIAVSIWQRAGFL